MSYKGRYVPTNPKKYKGNPNTIYYRSLWERKFMVYCVKKNNGMTRKMIIEVKPKKYTVAPEQNPKRKTKSWVKDIYEWGRNSAKWKSASEYCKDRNMEFMILTEDHLMPKYK